MKRGISEVVDGSGLESLPAAATSRPSTSITPRSHCA